MPEPSISSIFDCDQALHRLLVATLRSEKLTADRDSEIAEVQKRYMPRLTRAGEIIAALETDIQAFYEENRADLEQNGMKSVQLANGWLGMRSPSQPALEPLNSRWTWETIGAKVKELWGEKYFHKPKPPALDKVKLKKERTPAQLRECGMKLDDTESFYIELQRLAEPDEVAMKEAA
jgi:Bacteriophage Mu Gam like protein